MSYIFSEPIFLFMAGYCAGVVSILIVAWIVDKLFPDDIQYTDRRQI